MSDANKQLDAIFEIFDESIKHQHEKLRTERHQEIGRIRRRLKSAKCEKCKVIIRRVYNECKSHCDNPWDNSTPIYSLVCHECLEYDWSCLEDNPNFTPYEFYRFLRNCSFSHDEAIWCYDILTGSSYNTLGKWVYVGDGWTKAFLSFFSLPIRHPQSFNPPTLVPGGLTQ